MADKTLHTVCKIRKHILTTQSFKVTNATAGFHQILYQQPRGFLLKHKEWVKLGKKNWLVAQTDPVPTPLRENGKSKWRVLKKRESNSIFDTTSPHSTKALKHSICLSEEDSNRKKKNLLYFDGDQNWNKNELQTGGRKEMWHRKRGDFTVQALIQHRQHCSVLLGQENTAFLL